MNTLAQWIGYAAMLYWSAIIMAENIGRLQIWWTWRKGKP